MKNQTIFQKVINIMAYGRTRPEPVNIRYVKQGPSSYELFLKGKLNEMQQRIKIAGIISPWESPKMPFASMIPKVEMDTDILDSFGFLVDASVGQGYLITAAQQGIVDHVINFMEENMADEMTMIQGSEDLIYGNSFWLKTPEDKNFFTWYKLGAVLGAKLNLQTYTVEKYRTSGYKEQDADDFIHFTWRRSNGSIFGIGGAYPLLTERPYQTYKNDGTPEVLVVPATTEMKKQMQHDALIRHHKSIGKAIISAQVEDNTKLSDLAKEVNTEYTGVDHLVNYDVKINEMGIQRRIMEADVKNMIDEEYIKASGNPETKLITAQGYTEASALAAVKAAAIRLASFERYMSKMWQNNMLRMWYETDPYLDANGVAIPWKFAQIKIEWGKEDHGVMDAASFVQLLSNLEMLQRNNIRILTSKEIRRNLRRFQLELDSDETLGIMDGEKIPNEDKPLTDEEMEKLAEQAKNIGNKVDKIKNVLQQKPPKKYNVKYGGKEFEVVSS